jgi:hypothetical protein
VAGQGEKAVRQVNRETSKKEKCISRHVSLFTCVLFYWESDLSKWQL